MPMGDFDSNGGKDALISLANEGIDAREDHANEESDAWRRLYLCRGDAKEGINLLGRRASYKLILKPKLEIN